MALISIGKHFFKYSSNGTNKKILVSQSWTLLQKANISGKILRASDDRAVKPKPFPYQEKKLRIYHQLTETTSDRFDDNSKFIVVDGPPAAGKSAVAKALAEEFDMVYVPETTMDMIYINPYGVNIRDYNHLFPDTAKTYDVCNFLSDPKSIKAANFQIQMFRLRYQTYLLALRHLMNTGQGVVFDRSVYTDSVFLETMYKFGYVSKNARSYYYDTQAACLPEIRRPHLVVYLDVPVNETRKRIIARKYGEEAKTLTPEYLQQLENCYKQDYLKNISVHAELLMYDWTNPGEVETIVEDIERIDFDKHNTNSDETKNRKMGDWFFGTESEVFETRFKYTNDLVNLLNYSIIPRYDVPEILMSGNDCKAYQDAWNSIPGNRYAKGYNAEMGDKFYFKSKLPGIPFP